jgi:hypothetical protein
MNPKLIDQINEAVREASRENSKVEIHCDHPTQIRVQVYRGLSRSHHVSGANDHIGGANDHVKREDVFQFTREMTHYI